MLGELIYQLQLLLKDVLSPEQVKLSCVILKSNGKLNKLNT